MLVLGIETSCDETAAAIVRGDGTVLSDVVASQVETHRRYGGVVPELASRKHIESIVPVVKGALDQAGTAWPDLGAVGVTSRPGLVGALLVGLQAAKAIAFVRGLPLVGVNHLAGHVLAVFLKRGGEPPPPRPVFPFVALLASGGHTILFKVESANRMLLMGQTRDDAAGEAFDKVAKLVGLGYPGGPIIDRRSEKGDPRAFRFPQAMRAKGSFEFSFSGVKTSVATLVARRGVPEGGALDDLCASFQHAMVEVLSKKAVAAAQHVGVKDVVLCGGVAANRALRSRAAERCAEAGLRLIVPPLASCTDNAAMIAYAAHVRLARGERDGWSLNASASSGLTDSAGPQSGA